MSSYRDDIQETAVASDSTWLGLTTITEELVAIAGTVIVGLMFVVAESAVASDQVIDSVGYVTTEQATISDTVLDSRTSTALITERATLQDRVFGVLRVLQQEQATASDLVIDRLRTMATETAQISDLVIAQRRVSTLTSESAKISDTSQQFASVLVLESAVAAGEAFGKTHAHDLITDSLLASDQDLSETNTSSLVTDSARIQDTLFDHLYAHNLIIDEVMIEDEVVGGYAGQAWTANVDTWAMSRYAPYSFSGLAVIDGVLYGIADDGVYAMDGGNTQINAVITTGKLDLSNSGDLVHPLASYLEYELSGVSKSAQMDVSTTQNGLTQTYTYVLPTETAEHITNGRFIFGRGLRGRHFTFSLRMNGVRGHINELSIETASTKRRV